MKLSDDRLALVVKVLRDLGARRILLFGSYARAPEEAQDIDLAVEGIPLRQLGAADIAVYRVLRMPFDLISRDEDREFFDVVAQDAVTLYGQAAA
jgi:predicted nucleotidyltransferase